MCDFVIAMKICQDKLYALYYDLTTAFRSPIFCQFNVLMDVRHENIIMKWITNLATSIEHLVFECQARHIWAQHQYVNTKAISWVINNVFASVVETMK